MVLRIKLFFNKVPFLHGFGNSFNWYFPKHKYSTYYGYIIRFCAVSVLHSYKLISFRSYLIGSRYLIKFILVFNNYKSHWWKATYWKFSIFNFYFCFNTSKSFSSLCLYLTLRTRLNPHLPTLAAEYKTVT